MQCSDGSVDPSKPTDSQPGHKCLRMSGIASALLVLVFLFTLIIASSNGTGSGRPTVFYVFALILSFVMAGSAYLALKRDNLYASFVFVAASAINLIVAVSFMIADAASSDCSDSAILIWWCTPGAPQRALPLVVQAVLMLAPMSVQAYYGAKFAMFLKCTHDDAGSAPPGFRIVPRADEEEHPRDAVDLDP